MTAIVFPGQGSQYLNMSNVRVIKTIKELFLSFKKMYHYILKNIR